MIIWGSRGLTSSVGRNQFFCPQCNMQREGDLKQVRRYFTLYFIPLIPLNLAGEFIECGSCAGTYGKEILDHNPESDREELTTRMFRVMVMAALADGVVDPGEEAEISRRYQELSGFPMPPGTLANEVEMAMKAGVNLNQFVSGFADELSGSGKAMVVKLAFHTMSASSGELQPGHQQQLSELAETLSVPEQQFRELLGQLSNETTVAQPQHAVPVATVAEEKITISCPHCSKQYGISQAMMNKKLKCKSCDNVFSAR